MLPLRIMAVSGSARAAELVGCGDGGVVGGADDMGVDVVAGGGIPR